MVKVGDIVMIDYGDESKFVKDHRAQFGMLWRVEDIDPNGAPKVTLRSVATGFKCFVDPEHTIQLGDNHDTA